MLTPWTSAQMPETKRKAFALLLESLLALRRENKEVLWSSMVKDTMKRQKAVVQRIVSRLPHVQRTAGGRRKEGLLELDTDKRSRTYVVTRFGSELQPGAEAPLCSRARTCAHRGVRPPARDQWAACSEHPPFDPTGGTDGTPCPPGSGLPGGKKKRRRRSVAEARTSPSLAPPPSPARRLPRPLPRRPPQPTAPPPPPPPPRRGPPCLIGSLSPRTGAPVEPRPAPTPVPVETAPAASEPAKEPPRPVHKPAPRPAAHKPAEVSDSFTAGLEEEVPPARPAARVAAHSRTNGRADASRPAARTRAPQRPRSPAPRNPPCRKVPARPLRKLLPAESRRPRSGKKGLPRPTPAACSRPKGGPGRRAAEQRPTLGFLRLKGVYFARRHGALDAPCHGQALLVSPSSAPAPSAWRQPFRQPRSGCRSSCMSAVESPSTCAAGGTKMFTPFGMNISPLGLASLRAEQPRCDMPAEADLLTGQELVTAYLEPLTALPAWREVVTETAVLHVGRRGFLKEDGAGDPNAGSSRSDCCCADGTARSALKRPMWSSIAPAPMANRGLAWRRRDPRRGRRGPAPHRRRGRGLPR